MKTEHATITLEDALASRQALAKLCKTFDFPFKISYYFTRNDDFLEREERAYNKVRNERIKFYGEDSGGGNYNIPGAIPKVDEDGNNMYKEQTPEEKEQGKAPELILVPNPKLQEFFREVQEATEKEVSIEYVPIKMDDLKFGTRIVKKPTVPPDGAPPPPEEPFLSTFDIIRPIWWMFIPPEEEDYPEEPPNKVTGPTLVMK